MQRLLRILAAVALLSPAVAVADSTVHGLSTSTTSPIPALSCMYVDQGPGTDTKLCAGSPLGSSLAAALNALAVNNNLSDLQSASSARTNLGLGALATVTPGTGIATFLTTPSSANLAAALTDETGTGAAVFANGPTLIAPILGTPASGVATNLTGLPLATGVTGLLPIANGGTGTASPGLVAGSNVTITGSWPNQTIASSGGGGGAWTITDGTHSVSSVSSLTLGNGFVVSGSAGSATANLAATDNTKSADYTVAAADMANALNLTGTHTLTAPTASSTIFAPGTTLNIAKMDSGTWTFTNSTGLTYNGPATFPQGTQGTLIANADGTHLDWFGTAPDGSTITLVSGKFVAATGGSGCTVSGAAGAVFNNGSSACATETNLTDVGGVLTFANAKFALIDASAAFNVLIKPNSSTALTADRILTVDVVNAARTFKLGANLTIATDPGGITGALKSNGSGTFAQAACGDLSNGTTLCSTTPGTGVAAAAAANLSAAGGLTTTIASGTSAMGTSAIGSGACASVVTTSATNTATTDVVLASFNGDPTGVTGYGPAVTGMLTIISYPTTNNVNFKVCNLTALSITPGAITLNWRILR